MSIAVSFPVSPMYGFESPMTDWTVRSTTPPEPGTNTPPSVSPHTCEACVVIVSCHACRRTMMYELAASVNETLRSVALIVAGGGLRTVCSYTVGIDPFPVHRLMARRGGDATPDAVAAEAIRSVIGSSFAG